MKSISQGTSTLRIRSARKRTAPFSTPTMKRSRPRYSSLICRPSSATRRCRSSLETRVSPIEGSVTSSSRFTRSHRIRYGCSLVPRSWSARLTLGVEDAAFDHGADTAAEVEHRLAGAAQAGDLLGVVSGTRDRTAGGLVGQPLHNEA